MLICVWFKVPCGWRENSPQEAAGLLFHPPALLLVRHGGGKRSTQSGDSSPRCRTFQRQRRRREGGRGREKKKLQFLMKSSGSKCDASACLTRVNPSHRHLPALRYWWAAVMKRRSWTDAFLRLVVGVRHAEWWSTLISPGGAGSVHHLLLRTKFPNYLQSWDKDKLPRWLPLAGGVRGKVLMRSFILQHPWSISWAPNEELLKASGLRCRSPGVTSFWFIGP